MIDPVVVGLISAITALVASIAGPLTTLHIGRAQIRASVLSANRQRWIENFREGISLFCSQVAGFVHTRESVVREGRFHVSNDPETVRRFEALILTFTRIRLLTDPVDEEQQKMLVVMQAFLKRVQHTPITEDIQEEAEATAGRIIEMSLGVLRREWLRVKRLD
jgi:hypothetical protein